MDEKKITAFLTVESAEGQTNFKVSKFQLEDEFIFKVCCSNTQVFGDFIQKDAEFLSKVIQVSIAKLIIKNYDVSR